MADKEFIQNRPFSPIGLAWLIRDLKLAVPPPAVRCETIAGARRTRITDGAVIEHYPLVYAPPNAIGHLKFAMRHEPIDMGVLHAVFHAINPKILERWIRGESTGVFARRAWYLYELLTGKELNIADVPPTGYVPVLDPKIHLTGPPVRIRRQRVIDNLLGNASYCPIIRRTDAIESFSHIELQKEARSLIESCDPTVLARAINYLYSKETKSSFAIEGESPSPDRAQRFVAALSAAGNFDPFDPKAYVRLQNAIVDPRYAEKQWRTVQNFVGQTRSDFTEHVHFVCPKPKDVPSLMQGWMKMLERLYEAPLDAVCAAAAASFGFVFIHPFEDGNGRIHRFLIHHILARLRFSPPGLLFPVSAVMLRDRRGYDRVLAGYSSSILRFIPHHFDSKGRLIVPKPTDLLYRYWDATPFAEYLYFCVEQAIRHDLKEEIGFLNVFDEAVRKTMEIVDMPDRRASALVRFILQNSGRLSKAKRTRFPELKAAEIAAIEAAVQTCTEEKSVTR